MNLVAFIFAGIFALLAGALGIYALRARRQSLPFDSPLGLPGLAIRANDQAWDRGHCAATPFIGTAAIISLIQAMACGVAGAIPGIFPNSAVWFLGLVGVMCIVTLMVLATRTASQAAR